MTLQYITDDNGRRTAVQVPIEEWKAIQKQLAEKNPAVPQWQKDLLDQRLKEAKENPESLLDFDAAMDELLNDKA